MQRTWDLLYTLDLCAFLFFLATYYRNCYRHGYRIDFWNSQIFLYCAIPIMAMLPFERDDLNAVIVGQDLPKIIEAMPTAFIVAISGFFALYIGGNLWRVQLGIGLRRTVNEGLKRISAHVPDDYVFTQRLGGTVRRVCLCLQAIILSIYFSGAGFGFDLRAYTFLNPGLRPITPNRSAHVG